MAGTRPSPMPLPSPRGPMVEAPPPAQSREVPAHECHELRARSTRYCVVVPVINEGERIKAQLGRMRPLAGLADVIIADGGSTDGSLVVEHLSDCGVRTLLVKRGAGRLGAQLRMGLAYGLDQGYD